MFDRCVCCALATLALLTGCGGPKETTAFDGARAMAHVEFLVKYGPRPAGSRALTQAADYIQKQLRDLGLDPQVQRWREEAFKLELQNIWVQVDGDNPKDGPILVIGAHYDTKLCEGHPTPAHNFPFVGAIDGTGGPAVLLELARHLKGRKNAANVWLVFFDGEENLDFEWGKENEHKALLGSRYFVKAMSADKTRFAGDLKQRMQAMVLIDLVGDKNPKVDRDVTSDPELNDIFLTVGKAMGEGARMFQVELDSGFKDDHMPFRNYGIRVVDLIDFAFRIPPERSSNPERSRPHPDYQQWWHTKEDTVDKMSPAGLKFFGDLLLLGLPRIEKQLYGAK